MLNRFDEQELRDLVTLIGQGVRPIKAARLLFPLQPKNYVRITKDIRNYAWNKITAIVCASDNVSLPKNAKRYNTIARRIYKALPHHAQILNPIKGAYYGR